ncbi:hypothetical protein XELAEV_18022172mg [Xenopus laevis]|uniref:Uncharacterized protein n=1 Tax=Xenopus laevis TaxID=8355 RepID=A0A974HMZ2_XENLA|nr:hypothetical protein XELAEV_18022172mg [Xenopus laevis]
MSFEDISNTTTKCAAPFGFTEEERKRILDTVQNGPLLTPPMPDKNLLKHFEFMSKKELSLTLHLSTLSEYVKASRIPRGLRVHLEPILCKDNAEFRDKWHQILDRCSIDLMTSTIQALQGEIRETTQEIHKLTMEIKNTFTNEEMTETLNATKIKLGKLREYIVQKKLKKFKRDTQDYQLGQVYTWTQWRREDRRA